MKKTIVLAASIGLALLWAISAEEGWAAKGHGDVGPKDHILLTADEVKYQPAPTTLPPGAELAVLEGDPKKSGFVTFRIRIPEGYKIPPHWHPAFERVTVISGTFDFAMGEKFDESALKPYSAGSFFVMLPKMAHFAMSKSGATIQINTMGPWGITYVNPDDDPRNKGKESKK